MEVDKLLRFKSDKHACGVQLNNVDMMTHYCLSRVVVVLFATFPFNRGITHEHRRGGASGNTPAGLWSMRVMLET